MGKRGTRSGCRREKHEGLCEVHKELTGKEARQDMWRVCVVLHFVIAVYAQSDLPDSIEYDVAPWPKHGMYTLPGFPELAQEAGVGGRVEAVVSINKNGGVDSIVITYSSPRLLGFEQSVASALKKWEFTPAKKDDSPVTSSTRITFRFVCGKLSAMEKFNEAVKSQIAVHDSTCEARYVGDKLVTFQPLPIVQFTSERAYLSRHR